MIRPRRLFPVFASALSVLAVSASTASAGALVASAPACDAQSASQVFMPWADPMNYVLSPGGNFEGASWATTGNAGVSAGNEPWRVGGAGDSSSLSLGNGSSATSGVMCVGIEHPTVRFFARQTGGSLTGHLDVSVLWEDALGNVHTTQIASASAGSSWSPSAAYPMVVNFLALLPGERTPVAFKLAADGGSFQVDDFYVDPYGRS